MAQPSTAAPAPDTLIGTTISGRFKILNLVAKGGMGRVYRAEQSPLGRIVAVKVLHPNYSGDGDPEFSKRFSLEASVVSRLKHPNTVTVYDYGETDDGVYFMVMEFLEGRTLHRLIREEGSLDVGRALHILVQVARSLREAHGQGVIHRDLKPANIFLIRHDDDPDFVKVLDFGLVKNLDEEDAESLTKTGLFMGSPKYMAPEQIRGDRVTPATDVYALGVILFEMLTGRVPYDKPNSANLLLAHVNDPVPSMQSVNPLTAVPLAIEEIVYRCLAKTPEERFQSMDELIHAIKHAGVSVMGLGPSFTGDFNPSLSAPRAFGSGESRRASFPSMPAAQPLATTQSEVLIPISESLNPDLGGATAAQPPALPKPAPVPAIPTPAAPSNRTPVAIAGAVAALLVGAALWFSFGRTPPTPARPSPTTTAPALRPATTVNVVFESDPTGAEIFEHGELIGRTPLRDAWTGERGDPARSHTLTFRAPGYADAVVTLSGPTLVHLARLQRLEAPAVTPTVNTPAPRADAGTVANTGRRPVGTRTVNGRVNGRDAGAAPEGYRTDVY